MVGLAAALVFSRINPREEDALEEEGETEADEAPRARIRPLQSARETAAYLISVFEILRVDGAFRWFALSVFTYGFGNLVMMPIIPLVQVDELKMTTQDLSWLAILSQLVAVFAYFYWGRYIDFKSPQRAVVICILLTAATPLFYMFAQNFWWLLPAFMLAGIANAGIDLSYFNAILSFSDERTVSRYQALQSFLLGIRGTIAPFAGGAMATYLRANDVSLRYAFAVALVFILAGCWMQVVAMRRAEARRA